MRSVDGTHILMFQSSAILCLGDRSKHGFRHDFVVRRNDDKGDSVTQTPYILLMFDDLYNADILTLSASLKNERLDAPDGTARKVSKLCGSWLEIDVKMDKDVVSEVALRVQACALGQSSAAILRQGIIGATLKEISEARDALHDMLEADGKAPKDRFEKLELLQGVKAYPARHISTMLAFDAAVEAVSMALENA